MFRRKHKIDLASVSTEELSDELRRRGIWCVSPEHNAVDSEADARALVALSDRWGGMVRELGLRPGARPRRSPPDLSCCRRTAS